MLLTWIFITIVAASATIITLSVLITIAVIQKLMRNGENGFDNALAVHVKEKINDGNRTRIKVKITKKNGICCEREITSECGSSGIYNGQTIYASIS